MEFKTDTKNSEMEDLVEALCSAAELWDAIYIYIYGYSDKFHSQGPVTNQH